MKMSKPFQMNDWGIEDFLKVIFIIQLALWGVVCLDVMGLRILIIRPLIGFIYLTFIPGVIILRIFKIHNIDVTKFVLYSTGLSIVFVMFAGALTNFLLSTLKISQPISVLQLTATLSIFIVLLCGIAYTRDRKFRPLEIDYTYTSTKILLSPSYLFLLLLPFIAVFVTFFANYNQNNTLSLLLLFLIAVITTLIAFDEFIPAKAYPLAIYAIAISLVLHVSLISPYPYAWNIDMEYYYSELVATTGYWDSSHSFSGINSLLSIVMLAPIYSKMLDINTIWVFKAVYPFIHSLLPLAIFAACREQMDTKKAFFSSFFFMSLGGFFILMSFFRREQIAAIFLALLILVMIDKKLTPIQKPILAIAFIISLSVSHYGTSYLSLTIFFFGWVLLHLTSNMQTIFKTINGNAKNRHKNTSRYSILRLRILGVWLVSMLLWFMYIAGGVSFDTYAYVMKDSFVSLKDFFNPESRPEIIYECLGMNLLPADVLGWIFRIIHYSTEILIVVGLITLVSRPKTFKLNEEYRALLIVTTLFLFTIMFLPAMGKNWDTMRFYNFVLITIAPLIVFGFEAIWKLIVRLLKSGQLLLYKKPTQEISNIDQRAFNRNNQRYMKVLAIAILIPYFLFNVGFINEIAKNHVDVEGVPLSISLNRWNNDTLYFNEREVFGAEWLDSISSERTVVSCDSNSDCLLSFWFQWGVSLRQVFIVAPERDILESAYIYLRTWNIEKHEVLVHDPIHEKDEYINTDDIPKLRDAINTRNKIYDNGGAQVFATE
jgi:uncharacterized membrane protein